MYEMKQGDIMNWLPCGCWEISIDEVKQLSEVLTLEKEPERDYLGEKYPL